MKYSSLVDFKPITTIANLRNDFGDESTKVERVKTYVISDTMAAQLTDIVFRHLDPARADEHKGLLVVGNYGTGKSHLLTVISAIASDASVVPAISNESVRSAATAFAGQYNVVCDDIGAVTSPFRDIVTGLLQNHLDSVGVDFVIPASGSTGVNNKSWMRDMMVAYRKKFPGKGLLLVIDEMLDYLRALGNDQNVILAFGLMRELGEFANERDENGEFYGFRFIGGVQEAIFDSDRFAFVSTSLARVAERFAQVKIAKTDVKFVVAERLLKKTPEQLKAIKSHLAKFTKCYEPLLANMDEYAAMFPVHPDFINVFEQMRRVEKRRVLDTLSEKISQILDSEVPADEPGVIAFDGYWENVAKDGTARTDADVRKVIEIVDALESKIIHGSLKKSLVPNALRIVHALAVDRLSRSDISSRIGLDPNAIRDMLFVFDRMSAQQENPSVSLANQIDLSVRQTMKAVDGQYIAKNPDNGQYYIDIAKDTDYEQLVSKRAETIGDEEMNRAYFAAIAHLFEVTDVPTHVNGFRIWRYDNVRWLSHRTFRRGYLFFGAPDERSTAQPPLDFYLYFLSPFGGSAYHDQKRPDELIFDFTPSDPEAKEYLRLMAAAIDLRSTSSGSAKTTYESYSNRYLHAFNTWMQSNRLDAFSIIYKGERKTGVEAMSGLDLRGAWGVGTNDPFNWRDVVSALASHMLEGEFTNEAPDYPVFPRFVSAEGRPNAVKQSLAGIANGKPTKEGVILLDGLKLLDANRLTVSGSLYAKKILDKLADLGQGKVLNRSDLVTEVNGSEWFEPETFRLEPDLLVIVNAALVATGKTTLSIPGHEFAAQNIDELAATDIDDLAEFKHVSHPKGFNSDALEAAFGLVGLGHDWVMKALHDDLDAVTAFATNAQSIVNAAAELSPRISSGVSFLDQDLLAQAHIADALTRIASAKSLLERFLRVNTCAKLKTMPFSVAEIIAHKDDVALVDSLKKLCEFCERNSMNVAYFEKAASNCPPGDEWLAEKDTAFAAVKTAIVAATDLNGVMNALKDVPATFRNLEAEWIEHYTEVHEKSCLGTQGEIDKRKVLNSPQLKVLRDLSVISVAPKADLDAIDAKLAALRVCTRFDRNALKGSPLCLCGYSPKEHGAETNAAAVLEQLPKLIESTIEKWNTHFLGELESASLDVLSGDEKKAVEEYKRKRNLSVPIKPILVKGLKNALGGLEKIEIAAEELAETLKKLGPVEPAKAKKAFADFLDVKSANCNQDKVRFVVA